MWWDRMWGGPSWLAMTLVMVVALGGLAYLIALALREEYRPRLADPRPHRRRDEARDV